MDLEAFLINKVENNKDKFINFKIFGIILFFIGFVIVGILNWNYYDKIYIYLILFQE